MGCTIDIEGFDVVQGVDAALKELMSWSWI